MAMLLKFFGRDQRPETLSLRDWDRLILERRAGRVGPSGKPVGDRMVEWDLTSDGGLQLGREVEGRAWPPAP